MPGVCTVALMFDQGTDGDLAGDEGSTWCVCDECIWAGSPAATANRLRPSCDIRPRVTMVRADKSPLLLYSGQFGLEKIFILNLA